MRVLTIGVGILACSLLIAFVAWVRAQQMPEKVSTIPYPTSSTTGKVTQLAVPSFASDPPFVEFKLSNQGKCSGDFRYVRTNTDDLRSAYASLLTAINNSRLTVTAQTIREAPCEVVSLRIGAE